MITTFEVISKDPKEALEQYKGFKKNLERQLKEIKEAGYNIDPLLPRLFNYCHNIRALEERIQNE